MYRGPKKKGKYTCNGTDILIDGNKLTTTSTTYPVCITNKSWGEPVTTAKGQTYIKGGKTNSRNLGLLPKSDNRKKGKKILKPA